ncbi:MAG: HlyD family type I secretion periplasmic adaptor subunit [Pseudomonadales bacterium]|nr:HlyD family type I secretion periplasmic adaptor subunit [Pseudomonadales bacterium]
MSESVAKIDTAKAVEVETNDRIFRIIGLVIVGITFGLFGGWAAFAPLDSAALAPGVVTVESYRKTVQHLEGGIVREIQVRDGDMVEKGDVLLVLDDTQAKAQLGILNGQFITQKSMEARLLSERDGLAKISYPDVLMTMDDARVMDAKHGQDQVFTARKRAHEGEIAVLKQRIEQLKKEIVGVSAVQSAKKELVKSYDEEVADYRELVGQGLAEKQRLRELERNSARLKGEIAENVANIARIETRIGETELQILQLQKEFQTEVVNQLGEVQATLFDVTERMAAVKDTVARTTISAPESGRVLGLSVHTIGGVIAAGTPILDIVPQSEELIVEAQVSPIDIDRVEPDMLAEVRFSAFKSGTTPTVEGRVINISGDRLVDEKSGVPYYLARVRLTPESREKLGSLQLLPGMPAEVLINTGARTLWQYIVQPITDAFAVSLIED